MHLILKMLLISFVIIALSTPSFTVETTTKNTKSLLKSYEITIKASKNLDNSDNKLLLSWAEYFQMRQVNLSTEYRIKMIRFKEHNSMKNYSYQWRNHTEKVCAKIYRIRTKKAESEYYENEKNCLKTAIDSGEQHKQAVNQIGKEIRKWRRSYKYLSNRCRRNEPNDPDRAGSCLVKYIESDNYIGALQRLLLLKLEAMADVYVKLNDAVATLEKCLRTNLSDYVNSVKSVIEVFDKCL